MKKTYFQMVRDLKDFKPAHYGWLSGKECEVIRNTLCISELSDYELQNLRDFIVLWFSSKREDNERMSIEEANKLSGATVLSAGEK